VKLTIFVVAIAIACFANVSAAKPQEIDEGISTPTSLSVSLQPATVCAIDKSATCQQQIDGGALGLTFTWSLYCPQTLCLVPKTFEIERSGAVVSSVPMVLNISNLGSAKYAVLVEKGGWAPGDCFRIRAVGPAGNDKPGHFDYSDFSNKVCEPTSTPAPV